MYRNIILSQNSTALSLSCYVQFRRAFFLYRALPLPCSSTRPCFDSALVCFRLVSGDRSSNGHVTPGDCHFQCLVKPQSVKMISAHHKNNTHFPHRGSVMTSASRCFGFFPPDALATVSATFFVPPVVTFLAFFPLRLLLHPGPDDPHL